MQHIICASTALPFAHLWMTRRLRIGTWTVIPIYPTSGSVALLLCWLVDAIIIHTAIGGSVGKGTPPLPPWLRKERVAIWKLMLTRWINLTPVNYTACIYSSQQNEGNHAKDIWEVVCKWFIIAILNSFSPAFFRYRLCHNVPVLVQSCNNNCFLVFFWKFANMLQFERILLKDLNASIKTNS